MTNIGSALAKCCLHDPDIIIFHMLMFYCPRYWRVEGSCCTWRSVLSSPGPRHGDFLVLAVPISLASFQHDDTTLSSSYPLSLSYRLLQQWESGFSFWSDTPRCAACVRAEVGTRVLRPCWNEVSWKVTRMRDGLCYTVNNLSNTRRITWHSLAELSPSIYVCFPFLILPRGGYSKADVLKLKLTFVSWGVAATSDLALHP